MEEHRRTSPPCSVRSTVPGMRTDSREEHLADKTLSLSRRHIMTGKNVKSGLVLAGWTRTASVRSWGSACLSRKRRGTSGNDIIRPARKNGPMQPSVYGRNTCMALRACSVGRCIFPPPCTGNCPSWREPRETERSLWRVHQPPCLAASGRIQETTDMILEESLPGPVIKARPHEGISPMGALFCF